LFLVVFASIRERRQNMPEELDVSLDAAVASARDTMDKTLSLLEQAEKGQREFAEWKEAHGVRPELHEKLYAMLPDADRALLDKERERFARELQQDTDAALARAFPPKPKAAGRRRGQMFL
jgi:hypothetical protein